MIKNYFRIAFRNIVKHKVFAAINITGLVIGIASCLLLFTVIKYELSFDNFQPNYKKIYHVYNSDKLPQGIRKNPGVPIPFLAAMRLDIPEVTAGCLYSAAGSQVTVLSKESNNTAQAKFIEETGNFFSDPEFFQVFNFTWLMGSPAVLADPYVAVLSKKRAEKYFGNWKDAVGKYLILNNAVTVKIAGILDDPPSNSDFPLSLVTSFETFKQNPGLFGSVTEWGHVSSDFQVFILPHANITAAHIEKSLQQFSLKHYNDVKHSIRTNHLQPLSDVHFDLSLSNFGDHITSRPTLWTLTLIGIFIIIMACINFINLSTAQAVGRSKEVGIRKVLGSNRSQLFAQVMGETGLIVTISVIFATGVAFLCLPFIKNIASIQQTLSLLNWQTLLFLALLIIVVTLFSGLYPSLILSGFRPALALKNKITSATIGGISLRRGLVIMQFAISQVLIVGTIVAVSQMNYVRKANLGFDKDNIFVLNVNADSAVISRQQLFKQKLLQLPGVQSVSFNSDVPSSDNNSSTNFAFDHKPDEQFRLFNKYADPDYFKTFNLQFLAGRPYEKSDTVNEVVINETLMKNLLVKDPREMLGKDIKMGKYWKKIVGVIKDFKTNSLREEVKPLAMAERSEYYGVTAVKLNGARVHETRAAVESVWNELYPEYAFVGTFADEDIAKFYEQEEHLSLLYKIFAGIAIFISCLGLYGLVSFMAVQRTKEIGVRKVLGATVGNIVYLFSREFTILIVGAFIIAAPVAYYLMSNWLSDFAYRVKLGVAVFLLAIFISVIIAWVTVGYKAIRAAIANPVKSLRTE